MNKILLPLCAVFSLTQVQADLKSKLGNSYVKAANTLLFFTSENIISSGSYTFENDDEKLKTTFLPVTYHFDNGSNFYNFYINGSAGYSKYRERNITFRDSLDGIDIKTYALKVGGGVRFNFTKDIDMMMGISYIYSKVNSDYNTAQPLEKTDAVDRAVDYVFNSSNTFNTIEYFTSLGYQPTINEYKPYIRGDVRYFDTNIDDPFSSISDVSSTISKLNVGVLTPAITSIEGLPLKLEFYASNVFVSGDMSDALGSSSFYVLGSTVHLGTTTLNDWVSDVSFDVNIVRGDTIDGFNFGFGLSF